MHGSTQNLSHCPSNTNDALLIATTPMGGSAGRDCPRYFTSINRTIAFNRRMSFSLPWMNPRERSFSSSSLVRLTLVHAFRVSSSICTSSSSSWSLSALLAEKWKHLSPVRLGAGWWTLGWNRTDRVGSAGSRSGLLGRDWLLLFLTILELSR